MHPARFAVQMDGTLSVAGDLNTLRAQEMNTFKTLMLSRKSERKNSGDLGIRYV